MTNKSTQKSVGLSCSAVCSDQYRRWTHVAHVERRRRRTTSKRKRRRKKYRWRRRSQARREEQTNEKTANERLRLKNGQEDKKEEGEYVERKAPLQTMQTGPLGLTSILFRLVRHLSLLCVLVTGTAKDSAECQ